MTEIGTTTEWQQALAAGEGRITLRPKSNLLMDNGELSEGAVKQLEVLGQDGGRSLHRCSPPSTSR